MEQLDNATFRRDVLESEVPVLVDFTDRWCGPCQQLVPIIEELAKEYSDQLKVAQIDTDDNQDIASQFGIQSLPSLLLFNKGEELGRVGMKSKEGLKAWINEHLQGS